MSIHHDIGKEQISRVLPRLPMYRRQSKEKLSLRGNLPHHRPHDHQTGAGL